MEIILASASERRQELLKRLVSDFEVIVSDFNEDSVKFNGSCSEYVMDLAEGKALNVKDKIKDKAIILGCDTIVSFKDKILGKPKNEEEAFKMLSFLSGNTHQVYSGIALVDNISGNIKKHFVCTDVKFSNLTEEKIKQYISTKEPMDKAGAYGIQGYGGIFVEEIQGCYYNVVGLPLNKLSKMFEEMGVNL